MGSGQGIAELGGGSDETFRHVTLIARVAGGRPQSHQDICISSGA